MPNTIYNSKENRVDTSNNPFIQYDYTDAVLRHCSRSTTSNKISVRTNEDTSITIDTTGISSFLTPEILKEVMAEVPVGTKVVKFYQFATSQFSDEEIVDILSALPDSVKTFMSLKTSLFQYKEPLTIKEFWTTTQKHQERSDEELRDLQGKLYFNHGIYYCDRIRHSRLESDQDAIQREQPALKTGITDYALFQAQNVRALKLVHSENKESIISDNIFPLVLALNYGVQSNLVNALMDHVVNPSEQLKNMTSRQRQSLFFKDVLSNNANGLNEELNKTLPDALKEVHSAP